MKDDKLTGKEEHACERQYHTYFTGPSDILFLYKAIQCIKTKALLLHDASDLTFFSDRTCLGMYTSRTTK